MINFRTLIATAAVLALIAAAGCKSNNEQAGGSPSGQQPQVSVQPDTGSTPQVPAESVENRMAVEGKVLETLDAASYTYVNVETADGSQWVAVPQTDLEEGQEVAFAPGMVMQNLESKSLGRTFDTVVFSSGINPHAGEQPAAAVQQAGGEGFDEALQGEMAGNAAMGGNQMSSGGSQAAIVPSADVEVQKAEGENGYTVGEIHAQRDELNDQQVAVRGKVMKVSRMIMGKNWIHIQDGSGDPADSTHDLVVTTMAEPEQGSVVVVEGILKADRDFGSGYRYDVIIEDAEIK